MKARVCTHCGFQGNPVPQDPETFFVDALFWAGVGGLAATTGLLFLILAPLSWTIYHLIKYKTTQCPKCDNLDMVPLDSDAGKAALLGPDHGIEVWRNPAGNNR